MFLFSKRETLECFSMFVSETLDVSQCFQHPLKVDTSKPVSPKPGKQEGEIEAGVETTLFNFLNSPIPHGKESSDDDELLCKFQQP